MDMQLKKNHLKVQILEVTHIALNDDTVEGLRHKDVSGFHSPISPGSITRTGRCKLLIRSNLLTLIETNKQRGKNMPKRTDIKTF